MKAEAEARQPGSEACPWPSALAVLTRWPTCCYLDLGVRGLCKSPEPDPRICGELIGCDRLKFSFELTTPRLAVESSNRLRFAGRAITREIKDLQVSLAQYEPALRGHQGSWIRMN